MKRRMIQSRRPGDELYDPNDPWLLRVLDRFFDWLSPVREQCPWVGGLWNLQCIRDAGHRHTCLTERVVTSVQGDEDWIYEGWYGINYPDIGGKR